MCFTFLVFACSSTLFVPHFVYAQDDKAPVDLDADKLEHDKGGQTVTASGDVILKQSGRTVRADQIIYDLSSDTVTATGNIEFTDTNGDKIFAEKAEFTDSLKDGFVEGLSSLLVDGSRFGARNGRRSGGTKTVMEDASYTPCLICQDNPEKPPTWQLRASRVYHNKEDKTISYRNARFEIKGVPVAYLPYFEHPDGTEKRKSGFLTPSAGFNSDLGGILENSYYWDIAPDRDLTLSVVAMTEEVPLLGAEWRQRWSNASLNLRSSFTYSSRPDFIDGVDETLAEELRGHLEGSLLIDHNNKWRSGVDIDLASDDQYLRQYDLSDEDVLENRIYAERFSGRDYFLAQALSFQDVRVSERENSQPIILPQVEAFFIGEPGDVPYIGGRWDLGFSALGLLRDQNEQDVNRIHAEMGWKKNHITQQGLVADFDVRSQLDYYHVNDSMPSQANIQGGESSNDLRGFGYINAAVRYPMMKPYLGTKIIVEPIASVNVSPNITDDDNIPNEDSLDVQLDVLNLFNPSRFPGIDALEDETHVTYGGRVAMHADDGSYGSVFVGQSYRLDDNDNPFTEGSGLNEQNSDIVGQIKGKYKDNYLVDYRFQLDNDNLASQRHEVYAFAQVKRFQLTSQYLFAKRLDGTDIDETREQFTNGISYNINDRWRVNAGARYDLGEDQGLRTAQFGLDYTGQCLNWSIGSLRTLTDDSSGDSATEIFLRVGFKNLGEIRTSGFSLGSGSRGENN